MSDPVIELEIEDKAWLEALGDVQALVQTAANKALTAQRLGVNDAANLVILLTCDDEMRALNAQFRGQDKATNVLSFPAAIGAQGHLGDLALAFGTCEREADEQGKTLADHVQHLTVHGVLHLIGYDHDDDAEAEVMEALERRLLADLGITDPYGFKADGGPRQDHDQF
jgi:probable rRNA maturation factor